MSGRIKSRLNYAKAKLIQAQLNWSSIMKSRIVTAQASKAEFWSHRYDGILLCSTAICSSGQTSCPLFHFAAFYHCRNFEMVFVNTIYYREVASVFRNHSVLNLLEVRHFLRFFLHYNLA